MYIVATEYMILFIDCISSQIYIYIIKEIKERKQNSPIIVE